MNAPALLDRLDRLIQTGPSKWIARCPAHEDRSPSLSIDKADDRWLICCHAGCAAIDVVRAVGLELADLFDQPIEHTAFKRGEKPARFHIPAREARDLLAIIDHQAAVVAVIAADILASRKVDEPTFGLLADAARRIGEARDIAAPAMPGPMR